MRIAPNGLLFNLGARVPKLVEEAPKPCKENVTQTNLHLDLVKGQKS